MAFALIDTSVYVNHWEGVLSDHAFDSIRTRFVIRHSSVVLSELRRGARTPEALRLVEGLKRISKTPWTPAVTDWWECGALIQKIGDAHTWDSRKRREFQNDALIALSSRRHGAAVVTANAADFELLAKELKLQVVVI